MSETAKQVEVEPLEAETQGQAMHGRQLYSYFALLFLFLVLSHELVGELNAQFDLAIFPKLAAGIQRALDNATGLDNVLNTLNSLMFAFLFSLPAAIVYRITKDEDRFDPSLSQTIVLLSMVVTAVMIVISGDLSRAFGLAGVVAAVRFRNSLDDAKDAVYVFLAIAIGMACGAGAYSIAVWTSFVMTTALYLMWHYHFGQLPSRLLASREGGKKEKKARKEKKEKKGKDEMDAFSPPALSSEAQDRLDRMLEQQYRLLHMAALAREPGEKKSNAGVVVEARDLALAQNHAESVLAMRGKWRLVNVIARDGGGGTLEFVGRLSKTEAPAALIQSLLTGDPGSGIVNAEFRSLKGQNAPGLPDEPKGREIEEGEAQ